MNYTMTCLRTKSDYIFFTRSVQINVLFRGHSCTGKESKFSYKQCCECNKFGAGCAHVPQSE